MSLPLPMNAERILAARMKGMRPADMVIVSLVGKVPTENPLVLAECGKSYDWRWVRGLDLCIYLADDLDWPGLAKRVMLARPEHVELWNPAGQWGAHLYLVPTAQDVEKPVSMWRYDLDFLPWMEFQNKDFMERRVYERDEKGIPYAAYP